MPSDGRNEKAGGGLILDMAFVLLFLLMRIRRRCLR